MIRFSKYAVFVVLLLLLASCNKQSFTVLFPAAGGQYVGTALTDFRISYSQGVVGANIYLNGTPVNQYFIFGRNVATANIADLKPYIRQGANTFSVEPLGFGPLITFLADTKGPDIVITRGDVTGNTLEIEGFLRDPSKVNTVVDLTVYKIDGFSATNVPQRSVITTTKINVNALGQFCACNTMGTSPVVVIPGDINQVAIYKFIASDEHSFITVKEYLADSDEVSSMAIPNAMRMAIGDSFIESMRPIIASSLYATLRAAPIDIHEACWNDPNKNDTIYPSGCAAPNDGSRFNRGLNPLKVDIGLGSMPTTINRFYMAQNGTALLNGFEVQANNKIAIDLALTNIQVDLTIDGGWFLGNLDIVMTIDKVLAKAIANASVLDKRMNVQLDPNQSNFDLQNVTANKLTIWGIPLGGLVDILMPVLEGVIGDLLPGILNPILNDNLQKIVIGAQLTQPDIGTKIDAALNLETLKSDNILGVGYPYDLLIGLESNFNLLVGDPDVIPTLGSVYIEDPITNEQMYNSLGQRGTNLTVALSSNAVNQALAAMYSAGVTHFTIVNGGVSYGADAAKPVGIKGQTRVRLYPEMPPFFILEPLPAISSGATKAKIEYESAVLYFDIFDNGQWVNKLTLGVSMSIAANVNQVDQAVKLGVEGSPIFKINNMVNNTGIPIPQSLLQGIMDIVTIVLVPEFSDKFAFIDLGTLTDSTINGTQVAYLSSEDKIKQTYNFTTPCDGSEPKDMCTSDGKKNVCLTLKTTAANGGDGYDLVCETVNFVVNTNTVGGIGAKGSNLFFQMEARDPKIPPAPAVPRLDLDGDGVIDYRDNCSVPASYLSYGIAQAGGLVYDDPATSGIDTNATLDVDGNPVNGFEDRLKNAINNLMKADFGGANPSQADVDWWNYMRKGDVAIASNNLGSYPWITLMYSNTNQRNTDGDRIGELCEDDRDRDGMYVENYDKNTVPLDQVKYWVDNCPGTQQLGGSLASGLWANDGSVAYYNATETDPTTAAGDACDVRKTFVLIRNLASQDQGGVARCMAHDYNANESGFTHPAYVSASGNTGAAMKGMLVCNPNDVRQQWFMKNVGGKNYEFYRTSPRNDTTPKLVAYGHKDIQAWCGSTHPDGSYAQIDDFRMYVGSQSAIDIINNATWGAFQCSAGTKPILSDTFLIDPAVPSNIIAESKHPWYMKTVYIGKTLSKSNYRIFEGECATYSPSWGIDLNENECGTGYGYRNAILVGKDMEYWNGNW